MVTKHYSEGKRHILRYNNVDTFKHKLMYFHKGSIDKPGLYILWLKVPKLSLQSTQIHSSTCLHIDSLNLYPKI